jgi:DNA-binding NtrC family response regulator
VRHREYQPDRLKILLATRDDGFEQSLADVLQHSEYPTLVVRSCREALEYLLDNEVDLVVIDPDLGALDGVGTIELVKKLCPRMPVIVVSEDSSYETCARIAKAGVYFSMAKPIDKKITKELMKSVERRVNGD